MDDRYLLERFTQAQNPVYLQVCTELAAGAKTSHWMWFVFPQLRGLGRSAVALHFGLASLAEAQAYAQHPMLGARLRHCTLLALATQAPAGSAGRTAQQIFGSPDDLKFRSSMTLFHEAAPHEGVFATALQMYFGGHPDLRTLELLASNPGAG